MDGEKGKQDRLAGRGEVRRMIAAVTPGQHKVLAQKLLVIKDHLSIIKFSLTFSFFFGHNGVPQNSLEARVGENTNSLMSSSRISGHCDNKQIRHLLCH